MERNIFHLIALRVPDSVPHRIPVKFHTDHFCGLIRSKLYDQFPPLELDALIKELQEG